MDHDGLVVKTLFCPHSFAELGSSVLIFNLCVCFISVSFLFLLFLFFVAAGPVYGVGLVYLPGGLWPAKLKVPESEPSHCPGST